MKKKVTTPAEELYSTSKLAQHFSLSREVVRKRLTEAGVTPVRETSNEKLYRLTEAQAAIEDNDDPVLSAVKLRKLSADAELQELKLERERGEVVYLNDVRDELQQIFTRLFQRLAVQQPREIAGQLYKADSAGAMAEILKRSTEKVFNDLRSDYKTLL